MQWIAEFTAGKLSEVKVKTIPNWFVEGVLPHFMD